MSRVVSKAYAEALKDPGSRPPLALEDDEPDSEDLVDSAQATNQAILALTAAVGSLCRGVVAAIPKGGDAALTEAINRLAANQGEILQRLDNRMPVNYRFRVVRDNLGELDYVDASPGNVPDGRTYTSEDV